LEVQEAKLAEEQACGLHSFDERDLSAELEKLHMCVVRVEDECAIKTGELSTLFMEASNTLVDLGMLPIRDIPQLPKTAHEVMVAVGLILERMREGHASSTGPWD
jgi:hypothetical protein